MKDAVVWGAWSSMWGAHFPEKYEARGIDPFGGVAFSHEREGGAG